MKSVITNTFSKQYFCMTLVTELWVINDIPVLNNCFDKLTGILDKVFCRIFISVGGTSTILSDVSVLVPDR